MGESEQIVAPKVFVSYSWDSQKHTDWVLQLATRLRHDGIDIVLDRWDTQLGSDLGLFMEQSADTSYRVLAIVTEGYLQKANEAQGGVGYERRMITPSIMRDLHGHRVIPLLRDNPEAQLPHFLGAAKYTDFRSEADSESNYYGLVQDLHGIQPSPKPPLGQSPFTRPASEVQSSIRNDPARYVTPAFADEVIFNHSNNNGSYTIGAGEREFTLSFSEAGHGQVYLYNDPANIVTIALAPGVSVVADVGDGSLYDGSSRSRSVQVGDAAILQNDHGYWAVLFVDEVLSRQSSPTDEPRIKFRYHIPQLPEPIFGPIT